MLKKLALINAKALTPSGVVDPSVILIDEGKILKIAEIKDFTIPVHYHVIDLKGTVICPGFIDIHCNGGGGHLTMEGNSSAIIKIAEAHAKYGTTSYLPTIVTFTEEEQLNAIKSITQAKKMIYNGAKILGIHMEGPFLNPKKRGTHRKEYLYAPSIDKFKKYLNISEGLLKIITLSPELENANELISFIKNKKIVVSLGHTESTYEQAEMAILHGASLGTHVFNTMPPIEARNPGIISSLLTNKDAYIALITDGVHVHPGNIKLVFQTKEINKIIIVTDASPASASNLDHWEFKLGEDIFKIEIKGHTGYLDNNIAGTALTMLSALQIAIKLTGLSLDELWPTTSKNIAELLSIEHTGSLEIGKDADIVVLTNDENLKLVMTLINGNIVYQNNLN